MESAVQALSGREVEGRPLFIREDRTAIEKEEGFVVFVGFARAWVRQDREYSTGVHTGLILSHLSDSTGCLSVQQVGNIPWDCTPAGLREIFCEYSPYDVHIKTNMSGRSRGAWGSLDMMDAVGLVET